MFITENYTTIAILAIAIAILGWGYYRSIPYGKFGLLSWFQSVVLMLPWLVFFGCFSLGIYLNLVLVLFLLVGSTALYIYLGNRLRVASQDPEIQQQIQRKINQRLQQYQGTVVTSTKEGETVTEIKIELPHISDEDLQQIKGIFSIDTYFATETIPYDEGAIFKGNLRGTDPAIVHRKLTENLTKKLGNKYQLFLVEGPDDRPTVVILPSSNQPQPLSTGQKILGVILLITTIATTLETTGGFFNFDFYENLDRWPQVLPITLGIWSVLITHELGHWLMSKKHQAKIFPPFFLPSGQIATFGSITRFASVLKDRQQLFDIAIAGPAAGGILSLILLIVGLLLSKPDSGFEIPSIFFQGSILVGSLARIILGNIVQQNLLFIHPLVVIGWIGLVINALNLMPAGQLDGGRIIQSIYGRKIARRTTIATLVILVLITLINPANPITLYWAIVIAFLQRGLERPQLNELTEPDDARAALGLLALFLMIATIIPFSPELAGKLGIGG
jgi:membrane-associated protease RseP (regulator of RpoE activity)